ncbi:carbohydrate-binding module family 43 protein [Amniculicola lignicola CBS 123094]|uniref:1,3-beta-glucanosyltransferase n=1 Tax=Amniculicola lignicola CBS 123094 TaxID=1392246 RepID=A0A6A5X0F3_9PLEO|nr:carbohydrate-binding module family 43 protein [Amniculicola lignicola CBS 123094]
MSGLFRFCFLFALASILYPIANAEIDPIVVKGHHFFTQNSQTQFFIKGLYYRNIIQIAPSLTRDDLLADAQLCARDVRVLKKLGINLITIDQLDPVRNHTECMNTLADAGIYVLMHLHNDDLLRYNDTRWPATLLATYVSIVDALAPYDNTFGFYFGLLTGERFQGDAYPMLKAGVRDLKAHMSEKNYRDMPMGYEQIFRVKESGEEDFTMNKFFPEAEFLTCGEEKVDFMGVTYPKFNNRPNGCEKESLDGTELLQTMADDAGYPPVFVSKYGCLIDAKDDKKDKRNFTMVDALYNETQVKAVQGGVALQFFKDGQGDAGSLFPEQYGIFSQDLGQGSLTTAPGYTPFSSLLAKATPSAMKANDYNPSTTVRECSKSWSSWAVAPTLPPTPRKTVCECMMAEQRCVLKDGKAESIKANLAYVEQQQLVTDLCDNDAKENCPGIYRDASIGTYGAFSFCADEEVWTYAASQKWERDGKGCDYHGRFELRDLPPAPSNEADCEFILKQVGDNGKGTVTAMPATSGTPTTTPPPSQDSENNSSLSTGAKAGIGVAVAIVTLVAIGAALYFLRRRRRKLREVNADGFLSTLRGRNNAVEPDHHGKAELDGRGIAPISYKRTEMPASTHSPVELDGHQIPTELDSTSQRRVDIGTAV